VKASAREVARRVLRRVDTGGAFVSLALSGELERAALSPEDRGLATEIAYGVVRHRSRLTRALAAHAPRGIGKLSPAVRVALEAAAYQLLFLDRVPPYAAVDDAVRAVRAVAGPRVAGFANGLLRRLAREGEPPLPDRTADLRAHLEVACSLPPAVLDELARAAPDGELEAAALALSAPAPLWARVDPLRVPVAELAARLAAEHPGVRAEPSDLCREAVRLIGAGSPEASESFQDGLWTVQDLGAQLIGHLIGARPGMRVLDACAGVGGKATHLAQLAGDQARIDAADQSARKLDLLTDAARRLRLASIHPVASDLRRPGDELAATYDAILLDAPCSGLGVMRRHPELKWRLRATAVAEMAALQRELLAALWPRLARGGLLVYSVCTFTRAEGPEQIARFLAENPDAAVEPPPADDGVRDWSAVIGDDGFMRTWPHRHDADAFFAARIRRG
jgi:16S rRNA (cytosine967-C5)-methyltransferase